MEVSKSICFKIDFSGFRQFSILLRWPLFISGSLRRILAVAPSGLLRMRLWLTAHGTIMWNFSWNLFFRLLSPDSLMQVAVLLSMLLRLYDYAAVGCLRCWCFHLSVSGYRYHRIPDTWGTPIQMGLICTSLQQYTNPMHIRIAPLRRLTRRLPDARGGWMCVRSFHFSLVIAAPRKDTHTDSYDSISFSCCVGNPRESRLKRCVLF